MNEPQPVISRVVVVALVQNAGGDYLICRMPKGRGVFPGQWGLPGGGIEGNERVEDALRRELREELGVEVREIKPLFFKDGQYGKHLAGGGVREVYMIFLIFSCRAADGELRLSAEFTDYAWVGKESLGGYDLNSATVETFRQAGVLE